MDLGFSSCIQDTADFEGHLSHDDEDDDAAEIEERKKEAEEEFENAENPFSGDEQNNESDSSDDDSDDSGSSSESSDEESVHAHQSQFQHLAEHSSAKEPYENSARPNEPNKPVIPSLESYSAVTESDVNYSKAPDVNYLRVSDVSYTKESDEHNSGDLYVHHSRDLGVRHSRDPDIHHSGDSEVSYSKNSDVSQLEASNLKYSSISDVNHSEAEIENHSNISNINHSYASTIDQPKSHFMHRTEKPLNCKNPCELESEVFSKNHMLHTVPKHTAIEYGAKTCDEQDYGDDPNGMISSKYAELHEEFNKLQILYNTRGEELKHIQIERNREREKLEKENKYLKLRLNSIEGEKENLTSALQSANDTISDIKRENNVLRGKLTALELQFENEQRAKETAQASLESAEITIQSLEQQMKGLNQSDNALRLQQQNENVIKDLKVRHQREVLKYKEEIDKLQENLNSKIDESNNFSSKLSQLQKNYEQLQIEKCDTISGLTAKLETTQREYRKLLESDDISEVGRLRLQLRHLEEENSKLEKKNSDLKDDVRSLEGQLRTFETIKTFGRESPSKKSKKGQSSHSESDLKTELQISLENMHSLSAKNNSLKQKLEDLQHKLLLEEEKAKLFESRFKESEAKCRELEKKLGEVLPSGSIPFSEHEKKVKSLKNELAECMKKLQDLNRRFKKSHTNETNLYEENKSLKSTIAEMSEMHIQEKNKITEECKKKCQEDCVSVITKMKQDLTSKAESYVNNIRLQAENNIAELKKEIKSLHDGLYDAKAQYVKIFEENKSLQSKIDSMRQLKEREEIEKEIQDAYEIKLKKLEEQIKKNKDLFESTLKSEIEKTQEEWTKQKMFEIQKFINKTKQQLDEEFVKCLDQEKVKFEAERKKILAECQEKINSLQLMYEAEKSNLNADFQLKWESEMKKLQQDHQTEIESITDNFQKKMAALENEIKVLKEKSDYDFEREAEMESVRKELKQHYEEEKNDFATTLREVFQRKWKNEVKELQQGHQNVIESIKKSFQDKINTLENEIQILKKNHLEESNSEELRILKEEYTTAKLAWNSEKSDLINNENVLKKKLSSTMESEKKLSEENKKLKKYVRNLKIYKEKTDTLQKRNDELKKSILDKESELLSMKEKYDNYKLSLKEKHQKSQHIEHFSCQTEDDVVSRRAFLNIYEMFTKCLKTISEEVKVFLIAAQKRNAERLQRALSFYHDHLTSKIFRDVLKDACSISPNIGIPRVNRNLKSGSSSDNLSSPNTIHHQLNSNYKISNSTPVDTVTSGDTHKNLGSQMYNISNVQMLQNAKSTPNFVNGFADMSFDFVPIKMKDPEHTSVKLPHYSASGGLFHGENVFHSYPQRDSPISQIKRHL